MKKTPKLRFKEFSGDWEKTKLKNVTNGFEYGMNAAATEFDGENKYIRITDIDENSNKYINTNVVSPLGELEEKYLVKENDILFARTGASTGKTYLYDSKDGKLYFAGFLIRANVNKNNNSKFIFLQTKTREYDKWVKVMSMRSGQPGINSQEYASYSFNAPSKEEQEKIAKFFSLIDNKISLQSEKVEALKDYKKGLMQKIFNRELRFKNDEGRDYPEWEEKNLEEVADVLSGKRVPKGMSLVEYNTNIPYITVSDMGNRYVDTRNIRYITSKIEGYIKKYKVIENDIIISVAGTLGKINIIDKKLENANLTENCDKITNFKNVYYKYIYYYLNTDIIQNKIQAVNTISSQPKLALNCIRDFSIYIPSYNEQYKIANFLETIDNKIEKEQEKLNSLNDYKKGLLQQMFI